MLREGLAAKLKLKSNNLKKDFLKDIVIATDEISPDLIINFVETGINYLPISFWTMENSFWTMEKEGTKRVEVVAKYDKRQITAVFAASLLGEFLPPQLNYEGKTKRCLPCFHKPLVKRRNYERIHRSGHLAVHQ